VITSHPEVFDGVRLRAGQTVAVIRGSARQLLACERVTLNFLQRLSGIATLTRKFVDAVRDCGVRILDTRKTVPGLRQLDKYAVTRGGGFNHRADLSDGILIKNNHIALAGGIRPAIERVLAHRRPDQTIEVEVRTLDDLTEALLAGAERILLDNMSPAQVQRAVELAGGKPELEVSGGINLVNVRSYAETGVDFISVGALTHSAPAADLSMRIIPL
jgi:nicotinate-nucleotide pyrophosphorylase (carboxylating)